MVSGSHGLDLLQTLQQAQLQSEARILRLPIDAGSLLMGSLLHVLSVLGMMFKL